MPLTLTLRKGEDFFIDDKRYVVTEILGETEFKLLGPDGKTHAINGSKTVQVLPRVFVLAGHFPHASSVRVVLRAPREIKILRGENYDLTGARVAGDQQGR